MIHRPTAAAEWERVVAEVGEVVVVVDAAGFPTALIHKVESSACEWERDVNGMRM